MAEEIKQKLIATIQEIPDNKLGELLDFMEFLLEKERHKTKQNFSLDPEKDPILEFIGGVSHGSLGKDIDNELYGEKS
jgi:hypothetical protein